MVQIFHNLEVFMFKTKRSLRKIASISLLGAITPSLTNAIDGHDISAYSTENWNKALDDFNSASSAVLSFLEKKIEEVFDELNSTSPARLAFTSLYKKKSNELYAAFDYAYTSIISSRDELLHKLESAPQSEEVISVRNELIPSDHLSLYFKKVHEVHDKLKPILNNIENITNISVYFCALGILGILFYLLYLLFMDEPLYPLYIDPHAHDFLDKIRDYRNKVNNCLYNCYAICGDCIWDLISDPDGKVYLEKFESLRDDLFYARHSLFKALDTEIDAIRFEPFYKGYSRSNEEKKSLVKEYNGIVRDTLCDDRAYLKRLRELSEHFPQLNNAINKFESTLNNVEG